MRPASELRRLAIATGTYEGYNGDGASVPWSIMIPPVNFILYFYKRYLDRRWPDAFKMHDWLYTPYGQLIQATKDEADRALEEEIAVDSPRDAAIVYRAVSLGPAYWFGNSLTGYPNKNGNNIGSANRRIQVPTKCVLQFKVATGASDPTQTRTAGTTEFVYHPSDDITTVMNALKAPVIGLLAARAFLLPKTASIIGVKLYQGGAGRGSSAHLSYPGNSAWRTDVPQMALQMSCRAPTTGSTRRWHIKMIPDQFIVDGIFVPNADFTNGIDIYKLALTQFGFYTKPSASVKYDIATVVAIPPVAPATAFTGLVTTIKPVTFVVGDLVTFYSTVISTGAKYTVTKMVTSIASATQFTVANWTAGNTTGGKVGTPLKIFDSFVQANIERGLVATVKVGRPTDLYRGKASKHRKTA